MSEAPSTPSDPGARAAQPATPAAHADVVVDIAPPPVDVLFSPKQIAVATLLATPLAGALLTASNVRGLGRSDAVRAVVVAAGAAATALIFAVDVWGAGPFTLYALPLSAVIAWCASTVAFARWVRTPKRSHASAAIVVVACWIALGIASGVLLRALSVPLSAFGFASSSSLRTPSTDEALGDSVMHSDGERVFFRDGARREDAEKIASALAAAGYFTGRGQLRLTVDRADGELRVTMLVPEDATPADLEAARKMLKTLAAYEARCFPVRLRTAGGAERVKGRLCP